MHPFAELSAYLDGALGPDTRASVDAHLASCALCRARLAELRSTARLISALPMLVPSRSLVPRVSIPIWVAPLRTLSTIASGAALFLFIASALVASLGGSSQSAGTAAAPAPSASNATLDDRTKGGAGNATGAASDRTVQQAGASPAPTPAPQAFGPAAPSPTAAATPSDTSKFMVTPSEQTRQDTAASSPAAELHTTSTSQRPQVGLSPWAWLVLAIGFGVLAFVLGRRLRAP